MGLPLPSFTSQISFGIPVRLCFREDIFFVYVTLSIYLSTSATRAPFRVAESGFNKTVVAFRSSYPFLRLRHYYCSTRLSYWLEPHGYLTLVYSEATLAC